MKKQYVKPEIFVDELLKQDVLLISSTTPENKIIVDGNNPNDVNIP